MMQSMSPFLVELSVERIVVELDKTLSSSHPHFGLQHLSDLGITNVLAPALETLPDQFLCQSTDARLAEWMILNQPTIKCIERYGKEFRLTTKRIAFLKAATRLKDLAFEDSALCLNVFGQLGWLRGNHPDEDIDQLLSLGIQKNRGPGRPSGNQNGAKEGQNQATWAKQCTEEAQKGIRRSKKGQECSQEGPT